ncbi:Uncharacterised protein [Legionella steigerwaltii]|uniref:Uncharacterized protein n=1 Tax=Legionella steigerwaltii TaxID=460 RepID=A0A378LC11_9GAMM|nr:hypothetical protein [Legionella steigerwaltii]KTD80904.1 hypothetical protein Lstg_0131 [Legionella steigerwaltii]STY23408.1 Uncharacterised protein [Legionella steigerwaltii]
MQTKNEKASLISDAVATSLYAARTAVNISIAAKHIFFPKVEKSKISITDRIEHEFKMKNASGG